MGKCVSEWEWWNRKKGKTSSNVCPASSSRWIITVVEFFVFPLSLPPSLSHFRTLSFTSLCFAAVFSLRHVFLSLFFLFSLSCYRPLHLLTHSLFRFLTDWLSCIETVTGSIMEFIWMTVKRRVRVIFVSSQEQYHPGVCVCVCVCLHQSRLWNLNASVVGTAELIFKKQAWNQSRPTVWWCIFSQWLILCSIQQTVGFSKRFF